MFELRFAAAVLLALPLLLIPRTRFAAGLLQLLISLVILIHAPRTKLTTHTTEMA